MQFNLHEHYYQNNRDNNNKEIDGCTYNNVKLLQIKLCKNTIDFKLGSQFSTCMS